MGAIVAVLAAPIVFLLGSCGCASQIAREIGPDQNSHNVATSQPVTMDSNGILQAGRRAVTSLVTIGGGDRSYQIPPLVVYVLAVMWFIEHCSLRLERRRSHRRQIERIRNGTGA